MTQTWDEFLPEFIEWIKKNEVEYLTNDDFQPKVCWFDKDQTRSRLTAFPHCDGDWIAALPRPVAMLTAAQENAGHIAIISDSVGTSSPQGKHDGTPWQHGEMHEALMNKTADADLVYECLMILIGSADGTFSQVTIPYDRHSDGQITYREATTFTQEHGTAVGRLPDLLKFAFDQPKLAAEMRERFGNLGLEEDAAAMHSLAIAVKMVMREHNWQCMVGAESAEQEALLRRSFEEGPFSEGIRAFDKQGVEEIIALEESFSMADHIKEAHGE